LQQAGHEVILLVQHSDPAFNLCPVKKAPKVYTGKLIQFLATFRVVIGLLPWTGVVLRFISLERKSGTGYLEILKKIFLNAHILKQRLDWLHFGFATQALGKEHTAKAIGAKLAVSFRGFDINVYPLKHPGCYNLLWKQVDKAHAISNYLLEMARAAGLDRGLPAAVITPAVDTGKLKEIPEIETPLKLIITTIARLNWIKGLDTAMYAMAVLQEMGIAFEYHIIGSGTTKEFERYALISHSLGLTNHIHFHGACTHQQTLELLNATVIYIQPSYNEGFCNALLEAQALGKLCIAVKAGGMQENVLDLQTGWLVPPYDPEALAEKIKMVWQLPEQEKKAYSEQARTRVFREFSIEKQQQEFVAFYRE
jgi:colanic acid/amylovoran biosynthesis glycosyltransferase